MTNFREKLIERCTAKALELGRRLGRLEIVDEAAALYLAASKQRKKAQIDPHAAAILNVYPRREGGEAALLSISKAIAQDGFDAVLEKTAEYASAVARWSHGRKRDTDGKSKIPMPSTWFNQRRYNDDTKEWWEGTGGKPKSDAIDQLLEPQGWRFYHPDNRFVTQNDPWERIDVISQRWIIENTPLKENAV